MQRTMPCLETRKHWALNTKHPPPLHMAQPEPASAAFDQHKRASTARDISLNALNHKGWPVTPQSCRLCAAAHAHDTMLAIHHGTFGASLHARCMCGNVLALPQTVIPHSSCNSTTIQERTACIEADPRAFKRKLIILHNSSSCDRL